ncbi:MAG: LURP-one-related family protein [Clostridia bacterium]|nr:LURP-one-related family protein [Clostridia bacterium]
MKLYIEQRAFSWGDMFSIYDENGNPVYYVKGEVFTLGKRLHLYDLNGNELAYIEQKVFSFFPKYLIFVGGQQIGEVVQVFHFFKPRYAVNGLGWEIMGDLFAHEYEITNGITTIAAVSKEWFSFTDAYEIRFGFDVDEVAALSVCLVIDAFIDRNGG